MRVFPINYDENWSAVGQLLARVEVELDLESTDKQNNYGQHAR